MKKVSARSLCHIKDLKGKKFGRLKVLRFVGIKNGAQWLCACKCGRKVTTRGSRLVSGVTRSCGCLQKERRQIGLKHRTHHGCARRGHKTPENNVWAQMCHRCNSPKNNHYKLYGGNTPPVHVCMRWLGPNGFKNFLQDMGRRPKGTTLSRFGDVGDYKPSNCAWHTRKQQREEANKKRLKNIGKLFILTADGYRLFE